MIQIMTKPKQWEQKVAGGILSKVWSTQCFNLMVSEKAPCFSEALTNLVLGLLREITEEQEKIFRQ